MHLLDKLVVDIDRANIHWHVIQWFARADGAFGKALTWLGRTVFAPVHLTAFFKVCIKAFILNQIAFGSWDFIGDDQAVIIEDAYDMFFDSQNYGFPYQLVRDDKAVTFETNLTILMDLSKDSVGGIERIIYK